MGISPKRDLEGEERPEGGIDFYLIFMEIYARKK